jgi:UDP:flavonoid glycosyltransferase YjiC (YdhE family)
MSTMKRAIEALLEDAGYRDRIGQFAQKIRSAPGGEIAADVVERTLAS